MPQFMTTRNAAKPKFLTPRHSPVNPVRKTCNPIKTKPFLTSVYAKRDSTSRPTMPNVSHTITSPPAQLLNTSTPLLWMAPDSVLTDAPVAIPVHTRTGSF